MNYKYILIERVESIIKIQLNRADKLNAICFQMVEELFEVVTSIDSKKTKAVFILGNKKAFSAGGDLKEMQQLEQGEAERRSSFIHKAFIYMQNLDVPVVAFIQGICYGGGLELALHCDYRICSENTRFAMPEVKYGIIPGAGGTVQLPLQIGKSAAAHYLFTGEEFNATKALQIKLVQTVVDDVGFPNFLNQHIKHYNDTSIESLHAIKQMLKQDRASNLDDAYMNEAKLFSELLFKNGKIGIKKKFK